MTRAAKGNILTTVPEVKQSAAITAEKLSKVFTIGDHQVVAVDNASFELSVGEFIAVVGPSGSGKSSLLHLMGALDSPNSGTILVNGTDPNQLDDSARSAFRLENIGFVFQSFNLVPNLKCWENVALPAVLQRKSLHSVKKRAKTLLEELDVGDKSDCWPHEISGGQVQRVAIARALMLNPPIILADEPTGNLDSVNSARIVDLLSNLSRGAVDAARLVVVVTHDMQIAERTNRLLRVKDGRVN